MVSAVSDDARARACVPESWRFVVPGKPRPSQTGQLVGTPALDLATRTGVIHLRKARMFPKRDNMQWIENCRAMVTQQRARSMPWAGGVVVTALCYVDGSAAMRAKYPFPMDFDCDNAGKAILDGCKKLAFGDDKWVKKIDVEKAWGDVERTEIVVTRWP